jgi:putative transposase
LDEKREMVEEEHPVIPVCRQCELMDLSPSSLNYRGKGESEENLICMKLIDVQYTKTPFYGYRKMRMMLRESGYWVNGKRVRRLMKKLGLITIYPKKKRGLSIADKQHRTYSYLLNDVTIDCPNRVWCTDISYIKIGGRNYYLMAVMDWYSRYVLSWGILKTMDAPSCVDVLKEALKTARPDIFNSDQGSQFTSEVFIDTLKELGISISMDGTGRCFDNIVIERFWRTVKYEDIFLKDYDGYKSLWQGLDRYVDFYNRERYHEGLGYLTPEMVYFGLPVPFGEGGEDRPLSHLKCA